MITNFSKAEGSLLLGNVGNQPVLRQHRVGFQKKAVLRQSASKCIRAFICKITPYMIDWVSVLGVRRKKDLRRVFNRGKCSKYPPLRLGTSDFSETSEWQTSAKMCTGAAEGSHFGSGLNPSNTAGFVQSAAYCRY
jgi:hypothetical protein